MLERVLNNLDTKCKLNKDQPVLVAVSGGPDSLFLLNSLHRLDFTLIVAHFNHGFRSESTQEAEIVCKIAKKMNLPFIIGQENVKKFAQTNKLTLEEAARILRYRFLFQQAESHSAQAVAVGHTADDQVETVLMHLLRGAGLSGLKGMVYRSLPNAWSRSIPLVRPLLNVWRDEISAYLVEHDLHPSMDVSNLDVRFYRNRLRYDVIPYLERIQPSLRKKLWQTADILGEDLVLLEPLIDMAWEKCMKMKGPGYLALSPNELKQRPLGLQRHLFRRAIDTLRPDLRDISFELIERAVRFLNKPTHQGKIDLMAGLFLYFEKQESLGRLSVNIGQDNETASQKALAMPCEEKEEWLWLVAQEAELPNKEWPQVPLSQELKLDIPGEIVLQEEWRIVAEIENDAEAVRTEVFNNPDPFRAWLDLDSLHLPLVVRTRLPGDRFHPLGMGESVKVSDLMVNMKLPYRGRERWPLLLSRGKIAWVPGFRIGQDFRINEKTKRIAKIRVIHIQ